MPLPDWVRQDLNERIRLAEQIAKWRNWTPEEASKLLRVDTDTLREHLTRLSMTKKEEAQHMEAQSCSERADRVR